MSGNQKKIPSHAQCWLVGGGIGCLAAAIYLIENGVAGHNIHFIDTSSAQNVNTVGNALDGYTIHHGMQPYFHDPCFADFLSIIPDSSKLGKSLDDKVKDDIRRIHQHPKASVRLFADGENGPERVDVQRLHMRLQDRLDLAKIMIDSEESLGDKAIRQIFDTKFFSSRFWKLWSTSYDTFLFFLNLVLNMIYRFALQPWHSAVEFRRHLCKYLPKIRDLNDSGIFGHIQYTIYDSIIWPIMEYLEKKEVQFLHQAKLKAILTGPSDDKNDFNVSGIRLQLVEGEEISFLVRPDDIFIANLDPIRSKVTLGSNYSAPERLENISSGSFNPDWSLWYELSQKNPKFGNPSNFAARLGESKLVTFTVTLKNSPFLDLYTKLTDNQPGSGALVTLADSNWCLTFNIPEQPVFHGQPKDVNVFWGYGLNDHADGNFIEKPMYDCSGREIMTELLSHLKFPLDVVLDTSTTIPNVVPYATSAMVTRNARDRPKIIPTKASNVAVVGQFVEIPDETTFSMEYSVRSAQLAVSQLVGAKEPTKSRRNSLLGAFEILA